MTGIGVSDEAQSVYNLVKLGKLDYAIFTINGKDVVEEENTRFPLTDDDIAAFKADRKTRSENFKERVWPKFYDAVKNNYSGKNATARFIVLDFAFEADSRKISKLLLINWIPDNCPVRQRMVAAGTAKAVQNQFEGIAKVVQATDLSEVEYDEVLKKVSN